MDCQGVAGLALIANPKHIAFVASVEDGGFTDFATSQPSANQANI